MAAVAGLRGTGDWATDERPKNFREMILFRNPNGTAPLFALMAKMAEEAVDDPEFAWWDEPNTFARFLVNGALTNVATTFVIDSADPTATTPDAPWGVARHLKAGDLLLVENATEPADQTNEIVRVASVTNDTTFVVTRGAAGTTAAAIADNAFLLLIGSSYPEGSNAPDATTRNPIKYFNFTEIFKNAYEITRTASKTRTRTGDPIQNDKKRKIWDHSRGIELAFLFNQRSEVTGANGKPERTTGGLRDIIPLTTVTIFGATTTLVQYLNATYTLFDWDTPAGDERIAFCGNVYLNNLNLLARQYSTIQHMGVIKQFGMTLDSFRLPQGTIYLKSHPLLNIHSQYRASAFLIDASALKYRYITDTMFEDGIQTPGQDSKKGQWLTECGMEYRYAGRTLGYHGNFVGVA